MQAHWSTPRFWIAVAVLLAVMTVLMVTSSLKENQTFDEAVHLSAGYSYLATGDFRLNPEHPPLAKLLAALPLLALRPHLHIEDPAWKEAHTVTIGALFLYRNHLSPEKILFVGRLPMMGLTLVLGCLVAVWARRRFGPAVALFALFLYCLDPNLIAHGRYVTTDVIAALTIFLSCITWARYLETWRLRDLLWAGLALGLALAGKFSTLFLLGVLPLLYLLRSWRLRKFSVVRFLVSLVVALVLASVVLAAAYGPETIRCLQSGAWDQHAYVRGLEILEEHAGLGHPAYLLGENSDMGWWYYFPVAFAVKTPTAVLLLLLLCIGGAIFFWRRLAVSLDWMVLIVPPLAFFLLSMQSSINLGLRHILPVYPFLFVLLPALLFRARLSRKIFVPLVAVIVSVQLIECARIYPHFLAFFNTPSGGPENGTRYLVDSNLDWGQDVKKLKEYLDAQGVEQICFQYFGVADVFYHGIRHLPLPRTWEVEARRNLNCVVAISATVLQDTYLQPGSFAWLRRLKPVAKVGYSIYIYDLRKANRR